jgi:LysR family transcriptional regulator, glycine cleavage system transcriptional activator
MAPETRSGRAPPRRSLPPLKALLAFESAARHGSFAQAADELRVTPSAVSHQIQSLESFLGLPLFARRGGRVFLTAAGKVYCGEIEGAFRIIADATSAVAPRRREETLTILIGPSFAVKWLQPRLASFLAACPDAQVRLATYAAGAPLESAAFDIAIAYGAVVRPDAVTLPLVSERLTPLCSPALASALALRGIEDLRRATLIHSENLVPWRQFLAAMGVGELRAANELWIDRSVMAISAAVDGLGVILESDILTDAERSEGALVAPFPAAALATVGHHLVVRRGLRARRHAAHFIEWLAGAIPAESRAWAGNLVAAAFVDAPAQPLAQNASPALLKTSGRSS